MSELSLTPPAGLTNDLPDCGHPTVGLHGFGIGTGKNGTSLWSQSMCDDCAEIYDRDWRWKNGKEQRND